MSELELLVGLNLTCQIAGETYNNLLRSFGTWEEVAETPPLKLAESGAITVRVAELYSSILNDGSVERELEEAQKLALDIIPLSSEKYPPALRHIYDPPLVLYVKGSIEPADAVAIAVVGSRRCTLYGRSQARQISVALASRGVTIVSGLAHGIDAEAHRSALEAGGRTVGVLGSGFNHFYPSAHRELGEEIASSGAVISEFPLSWKPHRANFPRRNRIISGLSLGVVVVEGTVLSGSLITARWALEHGKEVFAVPGQVDSPTSRGPHALIKDGAKLVESAQDILEEFPDIVEHLPETPLSPKLEPLEHRIVEALGNAEKHIDELTVELDLEPSVLMSNLLLMEMKGLIQRRPGMKFSRK